MSEAPDTVLSQSDPGDDVRFAFYLRRRGWIQEVPAEIIRCLGQILPGVQGIEYLDD